MELWNALGPWQPREANPEVEPAGQRFDGSGAVTRGAVDSAAGEDRPPALDGSVRSAGRHLPTARSRLPAAEAAEGLSAFCNDAELLLRMAGERSPGAPGRGPGQQGASPQRIVPMFPA